MMDRNRGKNISAKILALILALILWIYVTNEQNPPMETTISVPLEVRNVASPLVAVDAPESVKVKIRGSRSIVAGLQAQDVKAFLDLRGLSEGRQPVKVYAQIPPSLDLVEISPDKVHIRLDTIVGRKLPVEIRLTGKTPSGTAVVKATVSPEQVTVEGPKSFIEVVDRVIIPLDLTGKTADFTVGIIPVPVNREGKEVEGLTLYPDKVNISANVVHGLNKKVVDIKTIVYGDMPPGISLKSITTKPEKVELGGDPQILDKIDFIYTEPINVAGIVKDTTLETKLQLKEGVLAAQSIVKVEISTDTGR